LGIKEKKFNRDIQNISIEIPIAEKKWRVLLVLTENRRSGKCNAKN
jgi:hypothetical protein